MFQFHSAEESVMTMYILKVISLLGGLALFLFGMDVMGKSLERLAGGKLQTILASMSSTVMRGLRKSPIQFRSSYSAISDKVPAKMRNMKVCENIKKGASTQSATAAVIMRNFIAFTDCFPI